MNLFVAVALGLSLAQMAPSPPQQAPSRGTATIRGKVVDRESGAPLVRAVVSLRAISRNVLEQNFTNEDGAFEFRQLAAGPYELRASAGEHRVTHVSTSYPLPARPGLRPPLIIKDAEELTDIVIALPRAYAISGRVTDEDGNPLANVEVTLPSAAFNLGGYDWRPRTTDDNGAFRVYGVGPGRYTVCADPRRGASFDRQSNRRLQYVRTCYPAATEPSEATEVTVAQGDLDGVEIRMQRRPLFVISGQVVRPDGGPPDNAQIHVTRFEGAGASGTGTKLAADGSFRISNVVPGTYEVSAQLGRTERGFESDDREPQWGGVRLEVTTADVEGVIVTLKRGVTVKGTVVYEDPPQVSPSTSLRVMTRAAQSGTGNRPGGMPASVADDGSFELKDVFGELFVDISGPLPRGYTIKSVLYNGRNIAYTATEFDGDPAHQLQIVLTNRVAELSGLVLDDSGAPVEDAAIVYFPVEASRWKGFWRGRGASSKTGRYRIGQLVAGDYFVAAVKASDLDLLTLPDEYDRIAAVAERVTVLESDRRTADLRLVTIPPRKRK